MLADLPSGRLLPPMGVSVFLHLTWTTIDRRPLVGEDEARFLKRFLPAEAQRHGAQVIALGIVSDHVHVLLRPPPHFDIPRLVQGLKGASARVANRDGVGRAGLRWSRGYDARSVSPQHISAVATYVRNQVRRHPDRVPVKSRR
ncbi:MAG: IS200/IS605 family transposase [Gaiellales bacterium]